MRRTISIPDAQERLEELVEWVAGEGGRVLLTRDGEPAAILVHPDEMDSLEETVAILQDDELMASLRRSRREGASGRRSALRRQHTR